MPLSLNTDGLPRQVLIALEGRDPAKANISLQESEQEMHLEDPF